MSRPGPPPGLDGPAGTLVGPVVRAREEADLYTETLGRLVLADLIGTHAPTEQELLTACARSGLAPRGLAELHHDPADRPQGLLIGFAAPSERDCPAALGALSEILAGCV